MEEKLEISKPGPKTKLFESTKYVFTEVDMSTVRSQVWQYFIRDKKHGIAKCKTWGVSKIHSSHSKPQ